jgi:DNA (cytosine-5)-methyltransferase 1
MPLNELSLFSGYGGFSLGLRLAGIPTRTVMYVEWERYPQEIIKARIKDGYLDDAPIWGDISTLDGEQLRGVVDLITAGFPCQPHSVVGLKRGAGDERNLWPETLRVIREVEPRWVLLENVPGLLSAPTDGGAPAYGGTVVGELASIGYSIHWRTIGADDVGAPHRRKRWWCIGVADADGNGAEWDQPQHRAGSRAKLGGEELADCKSEGLEGVRPWTATKIQFGLRSGAIPTWPPSPSDADGWAALLAERPDLAPALDKEIESRLRGVDHGRTRRVDELKALGNGIVPAVVALFLQKIGAT